ncbi:hypothetical protein AWC38_SpisGene58 [Paramuricea clavata]|uniref:Uncharacterized protein n=1 Tax=Paramuricea clavata TaxID=317549 RepID=A0A7D9EJR8_PARCT|nr:hypothetical protein AWC38_SpisGene58 [Paramuricea clavata]
MIFSRCFGDHAQEKREDLLYDLREASEDVFWWKTHILRSVNQDKAKEDMIKRLDENTVLIVMDWAMKFLPTSISGAYLRSDEGACYHNNMTMAACQDISKLTGFKIINDHFSEPGQGKDICDRIICAMKSALKTFGNEGNDILTASDMRKALKERKVSGTTACVGKIVEAKNSLVIKKVKGCSTIHNFQYESNGIRLWKAYGIGNGKLIKNDFLFSSHLERSSLLEVVEGQHFFENNSIRELQIKNKNAQQVPSDMMYECPQPGCKQAFDPLNQLEVHLDLGSHQHDT